MRNPIRVVNVRGLNRPADRAGVVYVGRPFAGWPGHALGNPFKPRRSGADGFGAQWSDPGDSIEECLTRYRDWLLARPTLNADLASLWEECGHGAKPLGCWCVTATAGDGSPVVCHAQILAELLAERFT